MKTVKAVRGLPLILLAAACDGGGPVGPEPIEPLPEWSAPQRIPINLTEQAFAPAIAFDGARMLLSFHTWSQARGPIAVHLMERTTAGWSAPAPVSSGALPAGFPQIAVDEAGAVHAVWGEKAGPGARPGIYAPTDVVYASAQSGGWSAPLRLHAGARDVQAPRQILVDPAGAVLATFVDSDPARHGGPWRTHLARRSGRNGTWSQSEVSSGTEPFAHLSSGGRLSVAFIWADTATPSGPTTRVNDVYIMHSDDGGVTWGVPVPVHPPDLFHSHQPVLTGSADGRLHVLWLKALTENILPDAIHHSTSTDGVTWSTPREVVGPEIGLRPSDIRAVMDGAGRLHIVFHGGDFGSDSRIYYARWAEGSWSVPEHLFGANDLNQRAALGLDSAGMLHLVVAARDIGTEPGLYYSTRPAR